MTGLIQIRPFTILLFAGETGDRAVRIDHVAEAGIAHVHELF